MRVGDSIPSLTMQIIVSMATATSVIEDLSSGLYPDIVTKFVFVLRKKSLEIPELKHILLTNILMPYELLGVVFG